MKIDIHVHPNFYEAICDSDEEFERSQEALNIHKNGYASLEHIRNQMRLADLDRLVLLGQDERSVYGRPILDNRRIAKLCDEQPQTFYGFGSVDPCAEGAAEQADLALGELGLKGLSINLSKLGLYPDDKRMEPVYEVATAHNRPILFHCGISYENDTLSEFSHPLRFENLAKNQPNLRIGLEHFGWPWVKETAMLMLKYPNVYVDTAALYFDNAREFYHYIFNYEYQKTWVERSLRHQLLFGSNNPRFEQIRMANAICNMGFTEPTLQLIMGGNALVFMGEDGVSIN